MRVLTVYAHPNPNSFCHAVLDEFTKGLRDAGHVPDVLDLYAMKFDPVFTLADGATWLHPDMPADVLERWNPRQAVLDSITNPLKRFLARRAMSDKDDREIARMVRERGPKDAAEQWRHVAEADAMAFIAPVWWMGFPAILKGWLERTFSYGNAFALDPDGWEGHVSGRIGLLKHEKALLMTPTLFSEEDYDAEWREPMRRIIDWTLSYPGVKQVEHVYFYRATVADQATIDGYLKRAYQLGVSFEPAAMQAAPPGPDVPTT
ncbi:MAG TPA: NAD(P)H-dependent oxidoreductase [Solirubrobacteraceae bacterium]